MIKRIRNKTGLLMILLACVLAATGCGSTSGQTGVSLKSTSQTEEGSGSDKSAASVMTSQTVEETKAPEESSAANSLTEKSESGENEETKENFAEPKVTMKELIGIYHLSGMTTDGVVTPTMEIALLEDMGMEMLLILNENGTGSLTLEEETKITWDEKTIGIEEESLPFSWDPNEKKITFSQDQQELEFTVMTARERIEAGLGVEGTPGVLSERFDDSKDEAAETVGFKMIGADWISICETPDGRSKGLCIWFEFTNNTDRYMAPNYVTAYATQDGKELEEGEIYPNETDLAAEETYRYSAIRPGVAGRSVHLFDADPEGGMIKYRVSVGYLEDTIIYEAELDPKKLPGRPKDKYEPKKISKIDWLSDVPEKGTFNVDYEAAILNSEIKNSGYDDTKYLRVWFSFTNNSEEEKSFFMTCYYRAVQDGITLNTGWTAVEDPDLNNLYEMVAPGETSKICIEWQLRDDSPVAVELYDWWTEQTQLGKVFEVK